MYMALALLSTAVLPSSLSTAPILLLGPVFRSALLALARTALAVLAGRILAWLSLRLSGGFFLFGSLLCRGFRPF